MNTETLNTNPSAEYAAPKKIKWIKRRGAMRVVVGGTMCMIIVLLVVMSVFWTPYDPLVGELKAKNLAPCLAHIFGTDTLGRDVFSRVLAGGRISLSICALALVGTTTLGVVFGLIAGYYGGIFDTITNMLAEIRQSMPMMLIMIVALAIMGPSLLNMAIILAFADWIMIFRTVRAKTMVEKNQDYVAAAKANGASNARILFKYILPNVLPSIVIITALLISSVILSEASLSYLGIGVTRPNPSWGRMVSDGESAFTTGGWWMSTFPALAIAVFVFGVNILADGLRETWKVE